MSSITGSASVSPPTAFDLQFYGSVQRDLQKATDRQAIDDAAAQRRKLKQTRLENQLLAAEWAQIMMRKSIEEALDPATDPRLRRDLRNDVLAHGIGKPREIESESAEAKRQGTDVNDLVRVLAALSTQALASQQQQRLERDMTSQILSTEDEAIKFLGELQGGVLIEQPPEDTEND